MFPGVGSGGRPLVLPAPPSLPCSLSPVPLLASIDKDILALLLRETTHRSEQFIAELSSVLQLYVNVGTDIFTIAKCSQKVGASSSRGAYFLGTHGGDLQAPFPSTRDSHTHRAVPRIILPAWEIKGIVPTKPRPRGEGDGIGMGCVCDLGLWRDAYLNVRGGTLVETLGWTQSLFHQIATACIPYLTFG